MRGFPKHFFLDDLSVEGEPTIQIVHPQDTLSGHTKVASEALDFIKNVDAIPGKTIILVLAMTAGEFYGPNRNGDGWPEEPLIIGSTRIGPDEVLPVRYKTFETDANVFKHHVNKDIAKRAGEVLKAFYNWDMHRVELLLALDDSKAADAVERIARGEYPAVSMGCRVKYDVCFQALTPVTTAQGLVPIEQISVGTLVRTHTGELHPVKETFEHLYTGEMYFVRSQGTPETYGVTAEHTYQVIRQEYVRACWGSASGKKRRCSPDEQGVCRTCGVVLPDPEWIPAKDIELGDYLVCPVSPVQDQAMAPAKAYVLGAYLGDGFVYGWKRGRKRTGEYKQRGLRFEMGYDHPEVLDRLETAIQSVHQKNFYSANLEKGDGRKDTALFQVYNPELAREAVHFCGKGSRTKFVHDEVLSWNHSARLAFVGGYLDADGSVDTKKGSARFGTTSESIAFGIRSVLTSLGMPSSAHKETPISGYTGEAVEFWVVCLGAAYVRQLTDVSAKARLAPKRRTKDVNITMRNMLCTQVTEIEIESVTDTPVYNIAVEKDESYIAGWNAVHNCSICGNKAPTRREYCKHARDLNGYMPDGRRKFVWNPLAKFFDISLVRRPADRLGFMMKKVAGYLETLSAAELGEYVENASQKIANLSKLSVIDKILRGEIGAVKDQHGLFRFKNAIADPAAAASTPIDDGVLRQLAQYRPAEMFSSLASMGVVPSLPEFLKLFVWKLDPSASVPAEALHNAVSSLPAIFQLLANSPELINEISSTKFAEVSSEDVRPFLRDKFAHLRNTRSFSEPYLSRRLVPSVFGEGESHTKTAFRGESRDKHQLRPLLGAGSLMYGTYMLSNTEKTGALDESRAMLALALNYAGQRKVASSPLQHTDIEILASCPFEQVAVKLGEVIYP